MIYFTDGEGDRGTVLIKRKIKQKRRKANKVAKKQRKINSK